MKQQAKDCHGILPLSDQFFTQLEKTLPGRSFFYYTMDIYHKEMKYNTFCKSIDCNALSIPLTTPPICFVTYKYSNSRMKMSEIYEHTKKGASKERSKVIVLIEHPSVSTYHHIQ